MTTHALAYAWGVPEADVARWPAPVADTLTRIAIARGRLVPTPDVGATDA